MEIQQAVLLELIGLIYDAAQDASRWTEFLSRYATVLNCHVAQLELFGAEFSVHASMGLNDSDMRAFVGYYHRVSPWGSAIELEAPGAVAPSHVIVPDVRYRETEYFNDFGKGIDQYYGLAGLVLRTSSNFCVIGAVRDKNAGPCTEKDADFVRSLIPHMARSLRMHRHFAQLNAEAGSLLECLDRLARGIVILDHRGRVRRVNRVAERMAAQKDGLHISESRGLRADNTAESAALQKLIREAAHTASGDGVSSGGTIAISRSSGRLPWIAVVSPHRISSGEGLAAVLLIDPESQPEPSAEIVSRLFGFTRSETKLALLLATGTRPEDAAAQLRVTMNTVRTHIRRMLDKTSLRRQTDLILLLNRLPTAKLTVPRSTQF